MVVRSNCGLRLASEPRGCATMRYGGGSARTADGTSTAANELPAGSRERYCGFALLHAFLVQASFVRAATDRTTAAATQSRTF